MSNRIKQLQLEDRIFLYILFFSIFFSLFLIIENILVDFPFEANYKWFGCIGLSLVSMYSTLNQIGTKIMQHILFTGVVVVILPMGWMTSGITNPFTLAYALLIAIAICYFFERSSRLIFIALEIIVVITMFILTKYMPQLFTEVAEDTQLIDALVQTPLTFIACASMISVFANAFRTEQKQLTETLTQLDEKNKILERLTTTDELTGIYNRRYVLKSIETYLDNGARNFFVGMIDIDNFKTVNDQYGHTIGDTIIQLVSLKISQVVGNNGVVGRYGGDEFVVILKDNDNYPQVIHHLKHLNIANNIYPDNLSLSGGFFKAADNLSVDDLLNKADQLLYLVKSKGKNDIMISDC